MKYSFLIIFLLLHLSISSQTLKGVVFDSVSKEKLQYVNLSFKTKEIGTFCDANGTYNLELSKASSTDTLVVSLIGYKNKNIPLINYLDNKEYLLDIQLNPKLELLNEVIVFSKKQKYTTSNSNLKTGNRKKIFPISIPFGYETATLIENKKNKKGKLIELNLKLRNASDDNFTIYQTYYRLLFYNVDELGFPTDLMNYDNIIIKPEKDATSYKIDLEDNNIAFNENGIFISILTVKPDEIKPTNSMYLTTPNIIYTHTDKKLSYTRFGSNDWSKQNRKSVLKKKLYKVPFFKVKVIYLKD